MFRKKNKVLIRVTLLDPDKKTRFSEVYQAHIATMTIDRWIKTLYENDLAVGFTLLVERV